PGDLQTESVRVEPAQCFARDFGHRIEGIRPNGNRSVETLSPGIEPRDPAGAGDDHPANAMHARRLEHGLGSPDIDVNDLGEGHRFIGNRGEVNDGVACRYGVVEEVGIEDVALENLFAIASRTSEPLVEEAEHPHPTTQTAS